MPRTREPKRKPQPESRPANVNGTPDEVLTLAEAAAYLRLAEAEVVGLVQSQGLPGRVVGSEWRFLKSAVQQWLSMGDSPNSNKEAWLKLAGVWKDDPDLTELLGEIHKQRGRMATEDRMTACGCE